MKVEECSFCAVDHRTEFQEQVFKYGSLKWCFRLLPSRLLCEHKLDKV